MRESHLGSGGRYPVLRTLAILWMVGAVIALVYGVYQAIVTLIGATSLEAFPVATASWTSSIMGCFIWLALTFFAVIVNLAVAEGIKLFIDIESSCRSMAVSAFGASAATMSRSAPAYSGDGVGGRFLEDTAESALIKGH